VTGSMPERFITPLIVIALLLGTLLALRSINSSSVMPVPVSSVAALAPDMVPLVTGDEPITEIFTRAGCAVCHTVPGIPGADGRVGPPLLLGTTGPARLADLAYRGHAKTVHDYVIESVIEPGVFVVPGIRPARCRYGMGQNSAPSRWRRLRRILSGKGLLWLSKHGNPRRIGDEARGW